MSTSAVEQKNSAEDAPTIAGVMPSSWRSEFLSEFLLGSFADVFLDCSWDYPLDPFAILLEYVLAFLCWFS